MARIRVPGFHGSGSQDPEPGSLPFSRIARIPLARSADIFAAVAFAQSSHHPPARLAIADDAAKRRQTTRFRHRDHKQRNTVERCINRLKQWCGLTMRSDKLAIAYQAALRLAAILLWARR